MENNEILTPSVIIENSIAQYNLTEAKIAEIAQQCAALEIKGVEDTAGYKAVKDAKNKVVKVRTGLDSKRKELGSDYKKVVDAINAEAKRLTALVEPIEEMMVKKLEAIDNEIAQLKAKDKEAKETLLKDAGFMFDGSNFFCCDIIVSPNQIENHPMNFIEDAANRGRAALKAQREAKELQERTDKRVITVMSLGFEKVEDYYQEEVLSKLHSEVASETDEQFNDWYESAKQVIDDRKAAAKKKADEEAAELESLRQEKIERDRKEKEAKDATFEARKGILAELGIKYDETEEYAFIGNGTLYSFGYTHELIYNKSEVDFIELVDDIKKHVELNRLEDEAIAEHERRTGERQAHLATLGFKRVSDGYERNNVHVPDWLIKSSDDWDSFIESIKDSLTEQKPEETVQVPLTNIKDEKEVLSGEEYSGNVDEHKMTEEELKKLYSRYPSEGSNFTDQQGRREPLGMGEQVESVGTGEALKEFHQTEREQWIAEGFENCQMQVLDICRKFNTEPAFYLIETIEKLVYNGEA